MVAVLAMATPDNIKFAINYFLGQNHFAVSVRAFWALRQNVEASNHENLFKLRFG
jgi:hypothetical protein